MIIIWILIILNIILIGVFFFVMVRLNGYIEKLEQKVQEVLTVQENMKQSFRNILVDSSFLLDDGKIKKTLMEESRVNIYNGNNLNEEGVEF